MKEINVIPFRSCGCINQGDSFFEISKKFDDHKAFKKSQLSKFLTSSVMNDGVHVFYSDKGRCIGVEVFPPVKLIYNGINLFEGSLKFLSDSLAFKKERCDVSDSGIDFPDLGLYLYSHNFEDSLICSVDSVYVDFSK